MQAKKLNYFAAKKACFPSLSAIRSKYRGNSVASRLDMAFHSKTTMPAVFLSALRVAASRGRLIPSHKVHKKTVKTLKAFTGKVLRLQRS
jgi:hypothetical protein